MSYNALPTVEDEKKITCLQSVFGIPCITKLQIGCRVRENFAASSASLRVRCNRQIDACSCLRWVLCAVLRPQLTSQSLHRRPIRSLLFVATSPNRFDHLQNSISKKNTKLSKKTRFHEPKLYKNFTKNSLTNPEFSIRS